MKNKFYVSITIGVITVVWLLSSCSVGGETQIQPSTTNMLLPTGAQPSKTPNSRTAIPTQNLVTSTPLLTSTPERSTPAPELTLSAEAANTFLLTLLGNNGGCELPCIWGISLEETGVPVLNKLMGKFGNVELPQQFYSETIVYDDLGGATFIIWENGFRTFIHFSFSRNEMGISHLGLYGEAQHEVLEGDEQKIDATFGDPFFKRLMEYYLVPQTLTRYGVPSQILIHPFQDDPNRSDLTTIFSVVLLYEEQGIFLEYLMPKETQGTNYLGCLTKTGYFSLLVWASKQTISFNEIAGLKSGLGLNSLNWDGFRPLQEATNMSPEEFSESFKNPDNITCLETPAELWMGP